MPYYGDYRGDYYAGDPGIPAIAALGVGLLRKAAPKVIKAVGGKAVQVIKKVAAPIAAKIGGVVKAIPQPVKTVAKGTAVVVATGAGLEIGARGVPGAARVTTKAPPEMVVPQIDRATGEVVYGVRRKYRRMNVCNVRALRRAGRRVQGFLKIANRLGALPVSRRKGKKLFQRKGR